MYVKQTRGFSLIELLMVVTVVAILGTIVVISLYSSVTQGKVAEQRVALNTIAEAMHQYRIDTGLFPPGIDNCSLCGYRCATPPCGSFSPSDWIMVAESLSPTSPGAPLYLAEPPLTDTWGNYYAYDNNYQVGDMVHDTILCSVGPDGVLQTFLTGVATVTPDYPIEGDDVCIILSDFD